MIVCGPPIWVGPRQRLEQSHCSVVKGHRAVRRLAYISAALQLRELTIWAMRQLLPNRSLWAETGALAAVRPLNQLIRRMVLSPQLWPRPERVMSTLP